MSMIKPAVKASLVTPNDSAVNSFRALYVGTGGNLNLLLQSDSAPVLFKNIPNGAVLPFSVSKVLSTSTTASDIVGLL
jgi:hypothetical protein